MNKRIYLKSHKKRNPEETLCDIRNGIKIALGPSWQVLQTPIILDNDLVDLLLVDVDGTLCIGKIVIDDFDVSLTGKLVADYYALAARLDKFQRAYKDEFIDSKKQLKLVLFINHLSEQMLKVFCAVALPIDVYRFCYLDDFKEEGMLLEKVQGVSTQFPMEEIGKTRLERTEREEKKEKQHVDSPTKMRQDDSGEKANEEEIVEPVVSDEAPDIDHRSEAEIHENQKEEILQEQVKESLVTTQEPEEYPQTLTGQKDSEKRHHGDTVSLTEDELIAFLDLEKKVDSYCNINNNKWKSENIKTGQ